MAQSPSFNTPPMVNADPMQQLIMSLVKAGFPGISPFPIGVNPGPGNDLGMGSIGNQNPQGLGEGFPGMPTQPVLKNPGMPMDGSYQNGFGLGGSAGFAARNDIMGLLGGLPQDARGKFLQGLLSSVYGGGQRPPAMGLYPGFNPNAGSNVDGMAPSERPGYVEPPMAARPNPAIDPKGPPAGAMTNQRPMAPIAGPPMADPRFRTTKS